MIAAAASDTISPRLQRLVSHILVATYDANLLDEVEQRLKGEALLYQCHEHAIYTSMHRHPCLLSVMTAACLFSISCHFGQQSFLHSGADHRKAVLQSIGACDMLHYAPLCWVAIELQYASLYIARQSQRLSCNQCSSLPHQPTHACLVVKVSTAGCYQATALCLSLVQMHCNTLSVIVEASVSRGSLGLLAPQS